MSAGLGFMSLAVAAATATLLLIIREVHLRALNARVSNAVRGVPTASRDVTGWISSIGMRYRRFHAEENLDQLRAVLRSTGFNHHKTLPIWLGIKIVSMVLLPVALFVGAQLSGSEPMDVFLLTLVGLVVGIMGPRLVLFVLKRRFDAAIRLGTPDAIDLLVVCSEAGMGLEGALQRVAEEMDQTNPAMSRVLYGLLDDLRLLPNRIDAFEKMGLLSDGLRRFGTMISQSLQYGTPLSQTLRSIAADLRRERITKLEERAHKLGAKLTIPMVLFLLPAMFVILGGGPLLNLIHVLK
ncbi:type II secretion system F family protein [Bradyrhizobium tunisiense]|uniref:type II secretion system F family protein n=1 Tax=Bradyrhizobium tunisiense TaxID=3278709 RepID=UPI0035D65F47